MDDRGITQVEVFWLDTVNHVLPLDTTIFIGIDRRFFTQITPVSAPSLELRVRIDVDDRSQYDETGSVTASSPVRFAYLFNQRLTRFIEVVL